MYRGVNTFDHGYKINQLMTYKAKACAEIRKNKSSQSEHHVEFLILYQVLRKTTARL
jgi:hypothetical protein